MVGEESSTNLVDACAADPLVYLLSDLFLYQAQIPRAAHIHLLGLQNYLLRSGLLETEHVSAFPRAEP